MASANVKITSSAVIKPPQPPSNVAVPLTVFDLITAPYELPLLYTFRAPMPDNHVLVAALARTLLHYPHLAGSFSADPAGRPYILLDGTGVTVLEATAPVTLDDSLPLDSADDLSALFPPFAQGDGATLSYFQLTRFVCGGLAMAVTVHHLVVDACALGSFVAAWARVARGLEPHPLPFHDRAGILSSPSGRDLRGFREKALDLVIHHDKSRPVDEMANASVHFSRDLLGRLKSKANEGMSDQCSTFQCLLAHVWKKLTLARGLDEDAGAVTRVQFAVNGRGRVRPALPTEYLGNFVVVTSPRMSVGELLGGSYAEVARAVRAALREVDDGFYKSFVELAAEPDGVEVAGRIAGKIPTPGDWLRPHMYNASFLGFGFESLSFGGGEMCSVSLPKLPIEGLSIFLPSFKEKGGGGGINAVVGMAKENVDLFQEMALSLD